jgi:hypothetical protein
VGRCHAAKKKLRQQFMVTTIIGRPIFYAEGRFHLIKERQDKRRNYNFVKKY